MILHIQLTIKAASPLGSEGSLFAVGCVRDKGALSYQQGGPTNARHV